MCISLANTPIRACDMFSGFVSYTILRLLAFFVCLLLLSLIPWMRENVLVLVLIAATVSMVISLVFLNGPREQLSEQLAERIEHRLEHKQAAHDKRHPGQHRAADEHIEDAEAAQSGQSGQGAANEQYLSLIHI